MQIATSPEPNKYGFIINLSNYCAAINVADSPCLLFDSPIPYYWYPINECSYWGYVPFFFASQIVNQYKNSSKPLLFHCHAGVCRSISVAYAIYEAHRLEGLKHTILNWKRNPQKESSDREMFYFNIKKGYFKESVIDLIRIQLREPQWSFSSVLTKLGKEQLIGEIPEQFRKKIRTL